MSYLQWKRLCKTCGVRYAEIDNIGVHGCRYHPGALNRDGHGKWHKEGCWECCGKSPYVTLPSGRRNPDFDAEFLDGCTGMDHSALQTSFTTHDNILEKDWPVKLCDEFSSDIFKLKDGKIDIKHKGLKIDNLGQFYVERFDAVMAMKRFKHKYNGSTCLTKEIFYQVNGSEVKSIVMEKNKTLDDLKTKIKATNTSPNETLDETKVYQLNAS